MFKSSKLQFHNLSCFRDKRTKLGVIFSRGLGRAAGGGARYEVVLREVPPNLIFQQNPFYSIWDHPMVSRLKKARDRFHQILTYARIELFQIYC